MIVKVVNQHIIILETPSNQTAEAGLRFTVEISTALSKLKICSSGIKANPRMTHFINDEMPTSIGSNPIVPDDVVAVQIQANHLQLSLAKIPV